MRGSSAGFITIDYLFAFTLTMGFTAILFSLSLTLTVASITQYVTFSAARGFSSSHTTVAEQSNFAAAKFKSLVASSVLGPFYNNGWFKISTPDIGDLTASRPELTGIDAKFGVGTQFTAAILDFNIPFFGKTDPDSDGSGRGFQAYIFSITGRESTMEECLQFSSQRWNLIKAMDNRYSGGQYTNDRYVSIADDGC